MPRHLGDEGMLSSSVCLRLVDGRDLHHLLIDLPKQRQACILDIILYLDIINLAYTFVR